MGKIDTVKIASDETESGYIIINKSDFNEAEHELFVEAKAVEPDPNAAKPLPEAAELMKLTKSELIAKAEEAGVKIESPDDLKKDQVVELILGTLAAKE